LVALLAIFKAGGAYVPLDPEYPEERLRFIVRDAGPELLVTQEKLSSRLADTVVKTIRVDADWAEIAKQSQDNPRLLASASNLAYIIYTSGSSGTPKGVMITQGGMLNCLQGVQQKYGLTAQDRFLMHISLSFDASILEVFWPLMVGARVAMAPAEGMLESSALLRYIAEQSVTCAGFVPSLLGVLVKDARLSELSSLRYVLTGAEKLPLEVMREFQRLSGAELHNLYGPTETALAATEWTCVAGAERVLIGRPIGNTQVYVLDGHMEPLPVGIAGELYIGGAGVGWGYAGQAELTAARFVPDRFSGKAGARLYRTGDLVRYDQEGVLEFVGRVDEQVKLHGYRIELGEIETVLRQHPQVRAAVVVLREEEGDKRLVAFVVSETPASELRTYLKEQLPDYMVPSFFVELDELPRLPNGKINRRALPALENSFAAAAEYEAPRTATEELLCGLWASVLRVSRVGVNDNFFDLGGHSLLAIQLISRIREAFGLELPLSELFEHPTVSDLAQSIERKVHVNDGLVVPPLLPAMREGALPYTMPMGKPLANTQIYVLDPHFEPVPVGVTGEIYIGGAGVGRGYWQRPHLTADRFVPDMFGDQSGARLYRTGDLARRLPDGSIEFLGRIDQRVKLRGFRIELGEIEAVLKQHDSVREAVVVTQEIARGEPRLVAYVQLQATEQVSPSELRDYLKGRLPEYMVPMNFVEVPEFALTLNGKINRRALQSDAASDEYEAPRTTTEELLTGLWASVLQVNRVGVNDNFFELGGHLLLAIQLISRIRETFGRHIAVRHVFEKPTLAELAQVVDAALRQVEPMSIPKLSPASRDIDLPLSFAQRRLWLIDQLEANHNLYNLPGGLRFRGPLNFIAIEQALAEVFRRHEALSTRFVTRDGQPRQLIAATGPVFLPIVDLSRVNETSRMSMVQKLSVEEARRSFDLTRGPLLRACLIRLSEEDHIGLFTMHHIVSDAWSMGLLLNEVTTLYTAFNRGQISPLPELEIQYHDFAVWQQTYLAGELLAEQLNYWKQQLADAPVLLNLPIDRPRPAIQSYSGGQEFLMLPSQITDDLNELCRRENMTQYMIMLASFQLLLSWYSGQDDIVVGAPVAGRDQIESEALVGFFVNTLVLRTRLSGNPDFREVLRRVRETLLGAYAHQNVPFEMLVETLMPERSLAHSPLFQVVVSLQNIPITAKTNGDLVFEEFPRNIEATRYDLELTMIQTQQGLFTTLTYNTDLFDAATIRRMLNLWQRLSAYLITHPDADLTVIYEHLNELDQQERLAAEVEFKHNALQQLKKIKRRVVTHIQ